MAISDVAHAWANKKARNKSSESASTDGVHFYSYSTGIAVWFDATTAVVNRSYYSKTTSKHTSSLHPNILPNQNERIVDVRVHLRRGGELPSKDNVLAWRELLCCYGSPRSNWLPKTANEKRESIKKITINAKAYVELGFGSEAEFFSNLSVRENEAYIADLEYVKKLNARYSDVENDTVFAENLQKAYNAYITEHPIASPREIFEQGAGNQLKKVFKVKDKDSKTRSRTISVSDTRDLYSLPVMLKVVGDQVRTSHGASVPLRAAKIAYDRWINKELTKDFHVGQFSVKDVTEDTVVIGCHRILVDEIKLLATKLNW